MEPNLELLELRVALVSTSAGSGKTYRMLLLEGPESAPFAIQAWVGGMRSSQAFFALSDLRAQGVPTPASDVKSDIITRANTSSAFTPATQLPPEGIEIQHP